jgi:hypothetical protein
MNGSVSGGQIDTRGPRKLSEEQTEISFFTFRRTQYSKVRGMGTGTAGISLKIGLR